MTQDNKQKLRNEIWSVLEKKNLIRTSKSSRGKIPNFKGAILAAIRLKTTLQWKNSQIIFSSPDSALTEVRENALLDGKILIMATPKLKDGYLLINPQQVVGSEHIASTINGAFQMGEKISEFPEIDLVVEGSLGVDLRGNRLGKGKGFADQEIEHLLIEGAIDNDTPICTPVHPLQIVDQVPVEDHDKKVSMIVTPERVIRIDSITLNSIT
jgi:5-formyltetrahydrofolate cyclo-ligase